MYCLFMNFTNTREDKLSNSYQYLTFVFQSMFIDSLSILSVLLENFWRFSHVLEFWKVFGKEREYNTSTFVFS